MTMYDDDLAASIARQKTVLDKASTNLDLYRQHQRIINPADVTILKDTIRSDASDGGVDTTGWDGEARPVIIETDAVERAGS